VKLRLSADWTWACSCDCHPELWDRDPERTCGTSSGAAARAEPLARRYPGRLTFSIGSELTLFMRGIVPDSTFTTRLRNPALPPRKPTAFAPASTAALAASRTPGRRFAATICQSFPRERTDFCVTERSG
jgi:hypothetical protein